MHKAAILAFDLEIDIYISVIFIMNITQEHNLGQSAPVLETDCLLEEVALIAGYGQLRWPSAHFWIRLKTASRASLLADSEVSLPRACLQAVWS